MSKSWENKQLPAFAFKLNMTKHATTTESLLSSCLLTNANVESDEGKNRKRRGTDPSSLHPSWFIIRFPGFYSRCKHTAKSTRRVFVDVDELSAEIRVWKVCKRLWLRWHSAKIL